MFKRAGAISVAEIGVLEIADDGKQIFAAVRWNCDAGESGRVGKIHDARKICAWRERVMEHKIKRISSAGIAAAIAKT